MPYGDGSRGAQRARASGAGSRCPRGAPAKEEVVAPETQEAEFVSLEEADAEAQGKKTATGEAAEGAEEEIELEDEPIDDATFIEEQEEGDEDVADIIGDVEDEEEEIAANSWTGRTRCATSWSRGFAIGSIRHQFRTRPSRHRVLWGHSSVGRALEWHSRGQGFDSPWLHQISVGKVCHARMSAASAY